MFKIDADDSFWWPVTVEMPVDGGKFAKYTFDAKLKRYTRSDVMEVMRQVNAGETTDLQVVQDVLVGWRGICDKSGDEIPFSEAARDKVLNMHPVCSSVIAAWSETLRSGKTKN